MRLSTFPKVFTKLVKIKSSLTNNEELPTEAIEDCLVHRETRNVVCSLSFIRCIDNNGETLYFDKHSLPTFSVAELLLKSIVTTILAYKMRLLKYPIFSSFYIQPVRQMLREIKMTNNKHNATTMYIPSFMYLV